MRRALLAASLLISCAARETPEQTLAACHKCMDGGNPCYKWVWGEHACFPGGKKKDVCEDDWSAVWCPSLINPNGPEEGSGPEGPPEECKTCAGQGQFCYRGDWKQPCFLGGKTRESCENQWNGTWCGQEGGSINGPLPPTSPPGENVRASNDSRLIAYLGNWQACPSAAQLSQYTHILISFAVTYTWDPAKNRCNRQCRITTPVPVCSNRANPHLVKQWRAAGKKVILSFGGAGMGGSWAGDMNDCWEHCFGKEDYVVSQLKQIVEAQNFDGVDLDYEYFHEDHPANNPNWTRGAEAQKFLKDVTLGVKAAMPEGSIVTHAPMEPDCVPGRAYYDVLKSVASSLDFLMPQYYNAYTHANIDGFHGGQYPSAEKHYTNLVNDMFGGDATRVLFGFCIDDCSGMNSNSGPAAAVRVMRELGAVYPCNGGAFFWVVFKDIGGVWSSSVGAELGKMRGCSEPGFVPPATPVPTEAPPTETPVPTEAPTPVPETPEPETPTPDADAPPGCGRRLRRYEPCMNERHCCAPEDRCIGGSPTWMVCFPRN